MIREGRVFSLVADDTPEMLLSAFFNNITPISLPAPIRIANLRASGVALRLSCWAKGWPSSLGRRLCGLLSPAWENISVGADGSATLRFCRKQCDGNDTSPNAYAACTMVTGVDPPVRHGCPFRGRRGQGEVLWPGGQLGAEGRQSPTEVGGRAAGQSPPC